MARIRKDEEILVECFDGSGISYSEPWRPSRGATREIILPTGTLKVRLTLRTTERGRGPLKVDFPRRSPLT